MAGTFTRRNTVSVSSNQQSWTSMAYAPASSGLGSGSGRLCACGFYNNGSGTDTHLFMTSDDLGVTWTLRNGVTIGDGFADVIWDPTHSLFIAARGAGVSATVNQMLTSPDGITWTLRTTTSSNRVNDVMATIQNLSGSGIQRTVVFGQSATVAPAQKVIVYTDNGTSYTDITSPVSPITFIEAVGCSGFGSSFKYIAWPTGTNPSIYVSGDGVTWGTNGQPFGASYVTPTGNGSRLACYSPDLNRMVCVMRPASGGSTGGAIFSTDDGTTFTLRHTFTTSFSLRGGICWCPDGNVDTDPTSATFGQAQGYFFAIGGTYGSGSGHYHFLMSRDGITWVEGTFTGITPDAGQDCITPVYMVETAGQQQFAVIMSDNGYRSHSVITADIVLPDLGFSTVTPNLGPTTGGTTIEITDLAEVGAFDSNTTISVGGNPCTDIVVTDANHISGVTPAGAVGTVDVVVTDNGGLTATITGGFTYINAATGPAIEMGNTQIVNGPAPSVMLTNATVTPFDDTDTVTYLWELVSQPDGTVLTPTISEPTSENTHITFNEYSPGTYEFKLTATETNEGVEFIASATARFVIKVTRAPRVTHGSVQAEWVPGLEVEIDATIRDDGWGGLYTESWEQLGGCATLTIEDVGVFDGQYFDSDIFLSYAWAFTGFPELTCIYTYRLTVTRADGLTGTAIWRIVVFTEADEEPAALNDGEITMLVNGERSIEALIDTVNIDKNLNSNPTCNFKLHDDRVEIFNDVVLERGGVRLFGGIVISQTLLVDEGEPYYVPSLVGYAWHLDRTRVTAAYSDSISNIARDLIENARGGITDDYIQDGLPTVQIDFKDETPNQCLARLVTQIPGGHYKVDEFKRLHLGQLETSGDPFPIASQILRKYAVQELEMIEDGSPVANRVYVKHRVIVRTPIEIDSDFEVESLEGYDPAGGQTEINGAVVTYTGTDRRPLNPVFGIVQAQFEFQTQNVGPLGFNRGGLPPGTEIVILSFTLVTDQGESPMFTQYGAFMGDGGI